MSDDDTCELPLQDQRVFGAGIKRKRVKFVPSTASTSTLPTTIAKQPATSVSDLYMRLVLPGHENSKSTCAISVDDHSTSLDNAGEKSTGYVKVCEICKLPLSSGNLEPQSSPDVNTSTSEQAAKLRPHEASLAHQVCLTHSYPPSHLDRNRKGLTYLSAYGWDPDSRRGLGAEGQGIQVPIKTRPKDDKLGIGVVLPKEGDRRRKEKLERLDAGKIRKLQEKDKKRGERLREMFYRNDDVERYLGGR